MVRGLQKSGTYLAVRGSECVIGILTDDGVLFRRAHQAEVARRDLETRMGAHAAEMAERDTQVAYLSSAVGLAEDLLTAKQR